MQTTSTFSTLLERSKFLHIFIVLLLTISDDYGNYMKGGDLAIGVSALRVQGEFDLSHDFFVFLAKFGFQKTDIRDPNNTQGIIYGNITISSPKTWYGVQQFNQNQTEEINNAGQFFNTIFITIFNIQYN